MQLSETGKMVHWFWFEIPNHFPFVQLGEFVVMPGHVHGIIIIDKATHLGNNDFVVTIVDGVIGGVGDGAIVETPKLGVSTFHSRLSDKIYRRANLQDYWQCNPKSVEMIRGCG